ncbi:MAG TPA: AAA family ATPase [Gaiellaceae bacterium]|nr:AAA family ATPase [Gaiellaceae bacterium]
MKTVHENAHLGLGDEPFSVRLDLLERERELATVDELIRASADVGRLLVIEGPPGIGKTSLILETKGRADEAGMHVLNARGSELESSFAYGVVRQLFEPFMTQLSDNERTELLSGAAAAATPLVDPAHVAAAPAGDVSLARLHGLFWLTSNMGARQPLLLAVDDLHWCDAASLRWLSYLFRRIEGLPVLLVLGLRTAEPGEDPALVGEIVSDPLAAVIRPGPLGAEATRRLVRSALPEEADDAFCLACHEQTGGNPLLLHELINGVAGEGLAPTASNVPRLRELAARAGSRAVLLRLARLPPEAARLAQAVAILGDDSDLRHAAILAELDEEAASDAAVALARADILRAQPSLAFVHPLVRQAVYDATTTIERDTGHARAARLLIESGAEPERVAAQLLLVPPAADPRVVAVLREASRRAMCEGVPDSAIAYLRRALAEPPPDSERADVLIELGSTEALLSGSAAVEHLQEGHALLRDPVRRAQAAALLGRQLFYLHRLGASIAVFEAALEELDGADAELERVLEAGLISTSIFQAPLPDDARRRLERIRDQAGDETPGEKMLLALLAFYDARACVPAAGPVALARRAVAGRTLISEEDGGGGAFIRACMVLAMADLDEALAHYDAALADAHLRGSVSGFAGAKLFRAQTFLLRGDLAESVADSRDAIEARRGWGLSLLDAFTYLLADALMEQGRLDEAADALEHVAWREPLPESSPLSVLRHSHARLRMLRGDLRGGLEETLDAGRRMEGVGGRNPAFMPWRSQAALALLQLGEHEEARRLAAEEVELARIWGAPRALGAALRAAGVIEGGRDGIALLEEAVEVLDGSPAKLEHAKARTELGAALRRSNRRSAAREHLRRAVELARICGAAPLAARAETELFATGARPRRLALTGVDALTPSERRVADMAAQGPTNREIAQSLFVTPKTVEVHLSSVYRKLGISSRSQLAEALARPARRS